MKIDFNRGGAKVIDRILIAYGFKTKLQLCHHVGLSSANLSMRYKRDFFPSDLVIRCMADTGVTLNWLLNEVEAPKDNPINGSRSVAVKTVHNGKLQAAPDMIVDNTWLPINAANVELIKIDHCLHLVEYGCEAIFSGKYLLEIEGYTGIYDIQRYPINRLKIGGGQLLESIECKLDEVAILAKVITVIQHV